MSQSPEDRVKAVIGSLIIEREILAAENEKLKAEIIALKKHTQEENAEPVL